MEAWTLGVDQSERYAAAVLLDPGGHVALERTMDYGDWRPAAHPGRAASDMLLDRLAAWRPQFSSLVEGAAYLAWGPPTRTQEDVELHVIVEDVPSRVMNPKPAMTLLGATIDYLDREFAMSARLPSPGRWQKDLGFVGGKGKTSARRKLWARELCVDLDYEPGRSLESPPTLNAKQREDLCDAFLIALWGSGWRPGDPITESGSARLDGDPPLPSVPSLLTPPPSSEGTTTCSCGNDFSGDNLCLPSACALET